MRFTYIVTIKPEFFSKDINKAIFYCVRYTLARFRRRGKRMRPSRRRTVEDTGAKRGSEMPELGSRIRLPEPESGKGGRDPAGGIAPSPFPPRDGQLRTWRFPPLEQLAREESAGLRPGTCSGAECTPEERHVPQYAFLNSVSGTQERAPSRLKGKKLNLISLRNAIEPIC